jgi:drug/metabolite transporter (DMT)-like permease
MTAVTPVSSRMGAADWGVLWLLSLMWGGSFFFNGVLVQELPPLTIAAGRLLIAAPALLLAARALGVALPRDGRTWAGFFLLGLLNCAAPFALIVWGQTRIGAGLASILQATTPLFTALVAHAFTRDERLSGRKAGGLLLGVCGVGVMFAADLAGVIDGTGTLAAQAAILAASLSYACAGVYGRRFGRAGVDPVATAAGQVACAALVMAPLALLAEAPWSLSPPSATALGALVLQALVSTALAYVVFFRLLGRVGATNASTVTLLVPVTAVLLGVAFLGERLIWPQVAGMALIAAGLLLADGRLGGWRRRPAVAPAV